MLRSFVVRPRRVAGWPLLAAGMAGAALLVGCGSSDTNASSSGGSGATKGSLTTVRVVGSGIDQGALIWPIYAAIDEGFFKKRGINFKYAATVSNATQTLQALTAGSADFAISAADRFVDAIDKGAPVTLAGSDFASVFQLYVKDNIANWSQLKGKTFGTSSTQFTGSDNVLKLMLQAHGIQTSQVHVLGLGSSSARFVAAKKGAVDGLNLSEPYASAVGALGTYKIMGDSWSSDNRKAFYPFEAFGFSKNFEQKNPQAAKNMMLAIQDGQKWVLDPANKQTAIKLLVKYTGVTNAVGTQVYKVYFEESHGAYANIGINKDKLQRLLAALGKPYSDKYNNSVTASVLGGSGH